MNKRNFILFILAIVLVVAFWGFTFLQDYFEQTAIFLQSYNDIYPSLSILLFISLSALSTMMIFFSTVWLVPMAIALWNAPATALFLLIGWLIGAIFSYFIGRYGGYPIVRKIILPKRLSYYENLMASKLNFWTVFLLRLVLPSEIPGYVLGIIRYPFIKYFSITFLAELPYAIYAVYAIDSIINKNPVVFFISAAIWITATWLLVHFYKKTKSDGAA